MKCLIAAAASFACLCAAVPALAQANPVLGKTIVCGTLRTTFAQNGDVTFNRPLEGMGNARSGKLKIVQNTVVKNTKDLQVLDARGTFLLHIQQTNDGRYSMDGDRCTVAR